MNNGQNYPQLPKRTKEMFLGYGGDKEFVVKSYVDASFNTDSDDYEYQSGYILKVEAISQSSSVQRIVEIEICIDVTLYDELFITSIIKKYFLSPLR